VQSVIRVTLGSKMNRLTALSGPGTAATPAS
jgi:hypothetical protein